MAAPCTHGPALAPAPAAVGAATPPVWHLAAGQALRLQPAPRARWLRLQGGQLWVTADGRRGAPPPQDWWLAPGESLRVAPGTAVLASGWPQAQFELLEEPVG